MAFESAPFGAGLVPRLPPGAPRLQELPGYLEGGWFVQEASQSLVVRFFDILKGSTIYDAAAAPGGKTIAMGRTARLVVAGDLRRDRVKRLRENLRRAGSGREHPIIADASEPPLKPVDVVVLDPSRRTASKVPAGVETVSTPPTVHDSLVVAVVSIDVPPASTLTVVVKSLFHE